MLKWSCRFALTSVKYLSIRHFLRWNHYQSLGLETTATMAEIKAAYYKMSKKYHPDRNNGSEESAKKFREIVAAYEVLSKPNLKVQYDREIARNSENKTHFGSKNIVRKRMKRSSNSLKAKSRFQHDFHPKFKQKNVFVNGVRKGTRKYEQEDFENFIMRSVSLLVACMIFSKKP